MNTKIRFITLASLVVCSAYSGEALADAGFLVEASPAWARPADAGAAATALTTYQYWYGDGNADANPQLSPAAAFAPTTSINPNGAASAIDTTAASDGVFYDGHDLYSFSGVLNPEVSVPQYNVTGQQLNVTVQVQYFGADITSGLTVTYTDASNVQQSVSFDSFANAHFSTLDSVSSDTEFGPADTAVDEWTFTVPNTSALQLDWTGWDYSSSLQDIAVDTQSVPVPVPEPTTMGVVLLGLGGILLRGAGEELLAFEIHAPGEPR